MKIALLFLLLTMLGCNKSEPPMASAPAPVMDEAKAPGSGPNQTGEIPTERMLVRTGTMTLHTKSPDLVTADALKLVQTHKGTVISQETQAWAYDKRTTIEIRIPSSDFHALLEAFRALGKVHYERISSEDVTEEFLDLSARLKNQRALEERFLELLTQVSNVQETVEVERELARVRGEIESAEGRSNFLKAQVAESKVTLIVEPSSNEDGRTMMEEVSAAFGDAWGIIIVVTGGLIRLAAGLLPIGIILFGFVFLIQWFLRRKRS